MPKTPLAVSPPLPPATPPSPSSAPGRSQRAPTRIASGAVPPATGPRVVARSTGAETKPVIHRDRATRVGTSLKGAEGLAAPGSETPKLRLTQGGVVPGTRYQIVRWLGEGGMGVVYEAVHVDIERRVALKILRFDLSRQPRMVRVFKDEAKAAGRLGSQYLVEIFDFGELSDGRLFFAMELLDGHDLVPSDEASALTPEQLIPFLRQVCKGLAVAHAAGVVHRDVKPENVITTGTADGRQQIKIVDFGISAMLAAGQDDGGVAGTPHYMAPEQILGQPFDGRLDIYALGCMAYELITGVPPFDADSVEELLQLQLNAAAIPPTARSPELRIPTALSDVIMRCLEKDPARRFRDTADLEAALCEAQISAGLHTVWDDMPIPALPDDPERQHRIKAQMPSLHHVAQKRSWLWPVVAAASTLAAVGLAAFLLLGRGPTDHDVDVIDQLTTEAREAAARADWVVPETPETPTAFKRVVDLEALPGSADAPGEARADQLRLEFAAALIKQGDELWSHGARVLARNYYFYSLLFDDSSRYALERSGTTPAMLANYAARARDGEFSDSDKVLAYLAAAEVEQDPTAKQDRLEAANRALESAEDDSAIVLLDSDASRDLLARRGKRRREQDEKTADNRPAPERGSGVKPEVVPPTEAPAGAPAGPEGVEPDGVDAAAAAGSSSEKTRTSRSKKKIKFTTGVDLTGAATDPQRAKELADEGAQALGAGRRSDASSLFNQAISFDRKNAKALMGLSDIYFDTGQSAKAVIYAEKAVKAAPSNQSYRLKLGDAYFKVLRYTDALHQYEEAKQRGASKAADRIAKVNAKLGG